jgi:hypothetical protein
LSSQRASAFGHNPEVQQPNPRIAKLYKTNCNHYRLLELQNTQNRLMHTTVRKPTNAIGHLDLILLGSFLVVSAAV